VRLYLHLQFIHAVLRNLTLLLGTLDLSLCSGIGLTLWLPSHGCKPSLLGLNTITPGKEEGEEGEGKEEEEDEEEEENLEVLLRGHL